MQNPREIRRGRDTYPFTNNFGSVKTAYKIIIPLIKQTPKELTEDPVTLGDHLRRRRFELGLHQKDIVARIGVTRRRLSYFYRVTSRGLTRSSDRVQLSGRESVPIKTLKIKYSIPDQASIRCQKRPSIAGFR